MELSLREHDTLSFILEYIEKFGISPTQSEIADGIGIKSRGVVHRYVKSLVKKGFIKKTKNKNARNIAISKKTFFKSRFLCAYDDGTIPYDWIKDTILSKLECEIEDLIENQEWPTTGTMTIKMEWEK